MTGPMSAYKIVRSILLAVTIGAAGGAFVQPSDASAETMLWQFKSNYRYKVQFAFYSQTRNHAWPGGGDAYYLNDDDTHAYSIACRDGEKICFGAWATGNAGRYWGVGYHSGHSCRGCCYVCGAGDIPRQVLN